MKNTIKIIIDLNDFSSINRAEKKKVKLENSGYTLVNTITGFLTCTLIYKKV
jgi:hypothetical protein